MLDKLRWFIADPAKLLDALVELERAFQAPASFREYIEIKVPDDPVPIPSSTEVATAPEPAPDPQLLAENEKLKNELQKARAALAEERKAHKAALEAERQEYDRRYNESWQWEISQGRAVNPFETPLNLNTFLVILRLRSSNRINVSFICETQALIATQNCLAFRYGVTQKKQQSRLSGFIHSFLYAWIKELGRCCGNPEEAYGGSDFRGALVVLPRV